MESNGKSVQLRRTRRRRRRPARWSGASRAPTASTRSSSCCIRARRSCPLDFLVAANPTNADQHHHDLLVANCFAQGEALMRGRTPDEAASIMRAHGQSAEEAARLAPHKTFSGSRPSSTLLYARLDPRTLGAADRALRAQGVRRSGDLEHQSVRPMGRRARQGARLAPRADRRASRRGCRASSTPRPAGLIAHLRKLRG